jgi:hypothetical protein
MAAGQPAPGSQQPAPGAQPFGAPPAQGYGPTPGGPVPPMGAPPGPQMGAMPVAPVMGAYGGGGSKASLFAGIGLAVLAGIGAVGYSVAKKQILGPGPGKASYSSVGIDKDKADGDKMITSVAGLAKKWQSDAIWWSVNYQAVHADGTVDLSKGAEVEYVSPKKVTSLSKKLREDGIKKFKFGLSDVDYAQKWNAINKWTVEEPEAPKCSIHDLTKKLADKGLKGSKTVRIAFDPQFDWGDEQTWHVTGEDPKIDARYSMKTCDEIGDLKAGAHSSGDDEE